MLLSVRAIDSRAKAALNTIQKPGRVGILIPGVTISARYRIANIPNSPPQADFADHAVVSIPRNGCDYISFDSSSRVMTTRIRDIPAVVEWADNTSTPRSFLHLAGPDSTSVQLSLRFDEQEQTAIFKFKLRVRLGGGGETPEEAAYLYLWIQPGDVLLLLQDPAHHLQDGVCAVLQGPTTCLRLVLSRPVCVVAPTGSPLPLQQGLGPQMLDSLISLTKQTVFAIHLEQSQMPDQKKIEHLCQAFCNGTAKQHPRHGTLGDFYKGHGAVIINDLASYARSEGKPTARAVDGPENARGGANPPPYAEAPRPLPSNSAHQPSNKRRRTTTDLSTTISADVNAVYAELVAQQKAQMDKFFSLQQAQMADVLARMGAQVDRVPSQVIARVDKCVHAEMGKIWDKKPREWEEVTRNIVQQEVDYAYEARLPDMLADLEDAVKEKCLDHLKDDLEGGLVTITLPR